MSSNVDVRKFKYALAPLLRRAHWELDSLRLELAQARKTLEQLKQDQKQRELEFESYLDQLRQSWNTHLNVTVHGHALNYVQVEKNAIIEAQNLISEKEEVMNALIAKCVAQQHKLELLEKNEQHAKDQFLLEQSNLLNAEIDRDWNARREWKQLAIGESL